MKYCPICPSSYPLYNGGYGMCLAQRYLVDEKYAEWYRRQIWHYLILDNGAAEDKQVSDESLHEVAGELKPHYMALPDVLCDMAGTLVSLERYLRKFPEAPGDTKYCAIPQGRTREEYEYCYGVLVKDDRIDMLGISKYMPSRADFLFEHKGELVNCGKDLHLFGMQIVSDILLVKNMANVLAIDSAIPVSYGMAERRLPLTFGDVGKAPNYRPFFDAPEPTPAQESMIRTNVNFVNSICALI